jgi:hypothetical protein
MYLSALVILVGLLLLRIGPRDESRAVAVANVCGLLALGFLAGSVTPTGLDTASVIATGSAALLPVLGLGILAAKLLGAPHLRPTQLSAVAILVVLGVYGLGRMVAVYRVDESYSTMVGLGVALAAAAALISALLAASSVKIAGSRSLAALAALPVAFAIIAASTPSLIALDRDRTEGLGEVLATKEADLRIVQGMTEEVGAGPRPEFRGKGFYDCDRLNSRDCFITHYDDIALEYGVAAAVADVVDKVKTNKGATFPAHCHQVVHNLGQLAYQLADRFADAAALDPQVCGTGYTHGLWEQQFDLIGTGVMFDRTGSLCTELNMVSDWYKWTCHHILGHMMAADLSMDPTTAAEYCTKVEDAQGLTDCLTGGWMNFFQDDAVIARMRSNGNMKELFGVCYGAPESTKFFCYQELFPVIYSMIEGDDYAAGKACLDLAEPSRGTGLPWTVSAQNYTDRCIQGLARGIGASSAQNPVVMRGRCLDMPVEAHDPCLTAAAASYVLNTGGAKTAFEICKSVGDQAYREYCYFWTKHARALLANGPNSENLPDADEVRLPESVQYGNAPGFFPEPDSSDR